MIKLSAEREAELLNEMELAELFTEKAWSAATASSRAPSGACGPRCGSVGGRPV